MTTIKYITADRMDELNNTDPTEFEEGWYMAVRGPYWMGLINSGAYSFSFESIDEKTVFAWMLETGLPD